MIIYGSRSSHLRSVNLEKETCTHCGAQGSIILSTYTRYAHIFWIPFFSVGRFSLSECQHCRQTLELKQMPAQIATYHYKNLAQTKLPVWQFAGLFLLTIGIVVGVYANGVDKEEQAQFIQRPVAGDVYEVKTESGAYTTFKVVSVATDTIEVQLNTMEVNKVSGIGQLDKDENYSDTLYQIPVSALKEMFAAGEIIDVNRRQ